MRLPNRQTWPRWARGATSPWLLSPVLVVVLVIGAFTAYGAYTRSKPTHYSRGGDAFGTDGLTTTNPDGGTSASPSASAAAKARHRARSGERTTGSSRGGTAQQAAQQTPVTGTSSAPVHRGNSSGAASAGPVLPRTGSYTLDVSGSEHVKFGPFSACRNSFPTTSQLVIRRAAGEPAGSFDFDNRFYPDSPNKHDERHIYRYTDDGVALSFEEATVTCGGVKQSSTVNYSPLQQRVPAHLVVGATWHNHGGDSNRTEDGDSTVVGTTRLSYGGSSHLVYVIDTHLQLTGDEHGTRDQRWWWAPDLGLPLKWHESLSGSRSGATYSEDVTVSVVSGP